MLFFKRLTKNGRSLMLRLRDWGNV